MRLLLIGGTGFIGARVARRLAEAGHAVAVLHRGETRADLPEAVTSLHADRHTLADARPDIERFTPDVVIDVIPYTEAEAAAAADFFAGRAGRLVVCSSGDVYRNYDGLRGASDHAPDPAPLAEDAPLRTTRYPYRAHAEGPGDWIHDYDKVLVEEATRSRPELPATVLRLPAVYGPGDRQHRLFPYLRRMDDGRPAILLEQGQAGFRWTHGYVENVAAAIATVAADERAAGQTFNVGPRETPTTADWICQIGAAVGWQGALVEVPAAALPESMRTGFDWRYDLALDVRRLHDDLDFAAPVAPEDALRRTIRWQRQHPPADAPPLDYAAEDAALDESDGSS